MSGDRIIMSAYQRAQLVGDETFTASIRSSAQRYSNSLKRLESLFAVGRKWEARQLQRRLLRSYSARIVCAVRSLPYDPGLPHLAQEIAKDLTLDLCRLEPVKITIRPKSSGRGTRPIINFGPHRKALDRLCADLLEYRLGTPTWNMLARGRGAETANVFLRSKMQGGYAWFVTADIESFYLSVQPKTLAGAFGLPASILECCISISRLTPLLSVIPHEGLSGAVLQGMTQGSRSASIIASWLIGPMLEKHFPAGTFIAYADDVLICASTRKEALQFEKTLHELFHAHPSGPFRLKSSVQRAETGVEFLKYQTRLTKSGLLWSRPSTKSFAKRRNRIIGIAANHAIVDPEAAVESYSNSWKNSFPAWVRNDVSEACLFVTQLEALDEGLRVRQLGLSP